MLISNVLQPPNLVVEKEDFMQIKLLRSFSRVILFKGRLSRLEEKRFYFQCNCKSFHYLNTSKNTENMQLQDVNDLDLEILFKILLLDIVKRDTSGFNKKQYYVFERKITHYVVFRK